MIKFGIVAMLLSVVFTYISKKIAEQFGIIDNPDSERKLHSTPTPLLGGVGIFFSFWLIIGYFLFFNPIFGIEILKGKLIASFVGGSIILSVGLIDEVRPFSARLRLIISVLAVGLAVLLGIGLDKVTNPLGGVIYLSSFLGGLLVFFWLLGMMYTTKITDGLDGLTTGVVGIGALMIYFLASSAKYYQPNVAFLSLILSGICAGFLIFNFFPAKIFLGESGSLLLGFLLGMLAVISGGKLAVTLLVMAIPVFDLARVIYVRFKNGQPIFKGDREHLHYQLLKTGLHERSVVLVYYILAASLGGLGLILQSSQKFIALIILLLLALGYAFVRNSVNKYG